LPGAMGLAARAERGEVRGNAGAHASGECVEVHTAGPRGGSPMGAAVAMRRRRRRDVVLRSGRTRRHRISARCRARRRHGRNAKGGGRGRAEPMRGPQDGKPANADPRCAQDRERVVQREQSLRLCSQHRRERRGGEPRAPARSVDIRAGRATRLRELGRQPVPVQRCLEPDGEGSGHRRRCSANGDRIEPSASATVLVRDGHHPRLGMYADALRRRRRAASRREDVRARRIRRVDHAGRDRM
jgi:hypothetical protein